jgi:hypothetical protein
MLRVLTETDELSRRRENFAALKKNELISFYPQTRRAYAIAVEEQGRDKVKDH